MSDLNKINSAYVKWDSAYSELKSGHSLFYFVFKVAVEYYDINLFSIKTNLTSLYR